MQTVLKVAGNLFVALALAALAACGGGGGDSPAVPAVAPLITSQPANATVTEGNTAQFSVAATGTAPLTYQWRRNGAVIAGATAAAFVTPVLTIADNATQYSVVVANTAGSVTSATRWTDGQRRRSRVVVTGWHASRAAAISTGPVLPLDLARLTRSHSMQRVTHMSRTLEIM